MKNFLLIILITIFSSIVLGEEPRSPRLFVMIELDEIIIDSIPPHMLKQGTPYVDLLKKSGFSVQTFSTNSKRSKNPKLDNFLKKSKQDSIELNDSNREKREETIVVRPYIKYLFEEISKLEIPTYILICSKLSNPRAQSIVENLDLDINKIPFKDAVKFVAKEYFLVHVNTFRSHQTAAKSAFELRNRYKDKDFKKIESLDYVILIDKLPDSEFILSNRSNDLNIRISPFIVRSNINHYNSDFEELEMKITIDKIKKFINKS